MNTTRELLLLLPYLETLRDVENVRKIEKRHWRKLLAAIPSRQETIMTALRGDRESQGEARNE